MNGVNEKKKERKKQHQDDRNSQDSYCNHAHLHIHINISINIHFWTVVEKCFSFFSQFNFSFRFTLYDGVNVRIGDSCHSYSFTLNSMYIFFTVGNSALVISEKNWPYCKQVIEEKIYILQPTNCIELLSFFVWLQINA